MKGIALIFLAIVLFVFRAPELLAQICAIGGIIMTGVSIGTWLKDLVR